ncbi:MAG: PspA/IM30 family protein [Myxococcota bacterium]|nr:PspA/IM30 family protein [Myxococcota bacterium]
MGFLSRLYNLFKGFLSIFVGRLEEKNPEIAYENAINNMTEKYAQLKSAAAGLIKNRAKLEARISKTENQLGELKLQIEVAVDKGEDEIAVTLLEQEEELNASLTADRNDLAQAASDAEKAKESLNSLRGEIDKLKREKDKMVAKIKDAEARKHIQEQLDGLSVDDEVKALENVREYAERISAEVQIGDELKEDSLESKLDAIKAETTSHKARARLEALKAARGKGTETAATDTETETSEKSL